MGEAEAAWPVVERLVETVCGTAPGQKRRPYQDTVWNLSESPQSKLFDVENVVLGSLAPSFLLSGLKEGCQVEVALCRVCVSHYQ